MKINLPRLTIQKGSTISVQIPLVLDDGETLDGFRASAYIKKLASEPKILCSLETKINIEGRTVGLFAPASRANSIPAGSFFCYVEMAKGMNEKFIIKNFIDVEP